MNVFDKTYNYSVTDTIDILMELSDKSDVIVFSDSDVNIELDSTFLDNKAYIFGLLRQIYYFDFVYYKVDSIYGIVDFNSYSLDDIKNNSEYVKSNIDSIKYDVEFVKDGFNSSIESIFSMLSSIRDKIDAISIDNFDFSSLSLVSLNGSYGTYKDGSFVSVKGLDGVWKVDGSFFMKNDDAQFLIVYRLVNHDDESRIVYVPSVFCSLASV